MELNVELLPGPLYPQGEDSLVPVAGSVSELVWTLWRRDILVPVEKQTLAVQPVTRGYTDGGIPTPGVYNYITLFISGRIPDSSL
jgi:hypothetical protein